MQYTVLSRLPAYHLMSLRLLYECLKKSICGKVIQVSDRRPCLVVAAASILLPLASIGLASFTSGWFSLLDNALSDLGTRPGAE